MQHNLDPDQQPSSINGNLGNLISLPITFFILIVTAFFLSPSAFATIDFEGFGASNSPMEEGEVIAVLNDRGVDVT